MHIHADILRRYEKLIENQGVNAPVCAPDPGTEMPHLLWMLRQLYTLSPADKASRWLGFIQGCLVSRGLANVTEERDFTRPYFTSGTYHPQQWNEGEPVVLHGLIVSKQPDPDYGGFMYEVKLSETEDPFWIRGNMLYNVEYDGIG